MLLTNLPRNTRIYTYNRKVTTSNNSYFDNTSFFVWNEETENFIDITKELAAISKQEFKDGAIVLSTGGISKVTRIINKLAKINLELSKDYFNTSFDYFRHSFMLESDMQEYNL